MSRAVGPLASTGYWVKQVAMAWQRDLDRSLRDLHLTATQFSILAGVSWLSRSGGPPGQQEVADFSGADRMMTSKVLAGLEQRGLVTRASDPADARVRRLALTPTGQELVTEATARARRVDAAFFGDETDLRERLAETLEARQESEAG